VAWSCGLSFFVLVVRATATSHGAIFVARVTEKRDAETIACTCPTSFGGPDPPSITVTPATAISVGKRVQNGSDSRRNAIPTAAAIRGASVCIKSTLATLV
jgi:hypothetical protein